MAAEVSAKPLVTKRKHRTKAVSKELASMKCQYMHLQFGLLQCLNMLENGTIALYETSFHALTY